MPANYEIRGALPVRAGFRHAHVRQLAESLANPADPRRLGAYESFAADLRLPGKKPTTLARDDSTRSFCSAFVSGPMGAGVPAAVLSQELCVGHRWPRQ